MTITKESISNSLLENGTTCINCEAEGDTNFTYESSAALTETVTCGSCDHSWEVSLAHMKVDCIRGPDGNYFESQEYSQGVFGSGRATGGTPLRNFAEAIRELRAFVDFYKNPSLTGYSPKRQAELIASLDKMLPL